MADVMHRDPAEPEEKGSPISLWKLALGAVIYFGGMAGYNYANRKDQTGTTVTNPKTGETAVIPQNLGGIPPFHFRPSELDEGATRSVFPKKIAPIWPQDSYVDVVVTLSPSFNPTPISKVPEEYLVLDEKRFHMNNYTDKRSIDTSFRLPAPCQNNGTLWGHFYIGLSGSKLDPSEPGFDSANAYHFAYPLTQYLPRKKVAKTRNLLDDMPVADEPEPEEDVKGPTIANFYHPNASFSIIPDFGVRDFKEVTPPAKQFLRLERSGARDGSGQNGWYYPILFVNNFWQLTTHMTVLNETVKELPLHIDLKNMVTWQFQTMAGIETNSKENLRAAAWGGALAGGGDGTEIEMVKEVLMDNNPILLGLTAFATVAHMILETLAFGSDIAHYRKKKDNVGISVRSILANVFMQTVIFLYLLDNSQNTSWMILGSQVVGIVIELWKITTIVNIRLIPAAAGSLLPYQVVVEDKHKLSETEEKTKEYDQIAFKYMYVLAVPLLIAYGIYSLMYETHKSWYSFVITTLVGSVYTYGFLMMVPSLYINYRLKSVAHMPAKAMMYKFLNTFIDDLFAFTIKMPILHRLATLRDDVIFFVYLYQMWKYRVDYTRVNEFGQGGEEDEADVKKEVEAEAKSKQVTAEAIKEGEVKAKAKAKATGADTGKASKRK